MEAKVQRAYFAGRRNPIRGKRQPTNFKSSNVPGDENRRAPTRPIGLGPFASAVFRPPMLPATSRLRGQLYYEPALGLTAPVSGNVVTYFFSANGLFDPNITGTGHQPIAFDQMMLLYEQCTVCHSSIEVTFNVGAGLALRLGVGLFPAASAITDPKQLVENGLLKVIPVTSSSATSTTPNLRMQTSVRLDCDIKKYFGRPTDQSLVNDVSLSTTAAANPTEQVYFGIVAWQISPDGVTTTPLGFDVCLAFDAIYWEPRKLGIS